MWVNIIKADAPSLNNNVYPEVVLQQAITLLSAPVYPSYNKAGDEGGFVHDESGNPRIGTAIEYRFENGWLQANLHFLCPHFASLVRDGCRVVRAAVVCQTDRLNTGTKQLIISIDRIDHLAICFIEDASWCDGPVGIDNSV